MSSKPKKKSKDPAKTFPYIFVHATSQKGSKKSKYMPKWKWERTMPKNHGKFDPDEFIEDSIVKGSHKQKVRHIPSGGNKRRTRRKKKRRKKGGQLNKKTKRKLDAWGIDVNAKGDLTKFEKKVYPENYHNYTMKDAINLKTAREFQLMMENQIKKNKNKKGGNAVVENLQSNLENLKENINLKDIKSNLDFSKDFFTKGKFKIDDYNISWCTEGKKEKKEKKEKKGGKARRKTRKRFKRKTKKTRKRKRKTRKKR